MSLIFDFASKLSPLLIPWIVCRQNSITSWNQQLGSPLVDSPRQRYAILKGEFVPEFILSILAVIRVFIRSRSDTAIEVLALRQQVAVLKRKRPRPRLNPLDRLFWTTLRRFWSRWSDVLVIVKPETVIGWHRAGFRLYWRWRSRHRGVDQELPLRSVD